MKQYARIRRGAERSACRQAPCPEPDRNHPEALCPGPMPTARQESPEPYAQALRPEPDKRQYRAGDSPIAMMLQ
jgi:hypothetical protein